MRVFPYVIFLAVLFGIAVLGNSCNSEGIEERKAEQKITYAEQMKKNIELNMIHTGESIVRHHQVITIDDCEYIVYKTSYGHTGTGFMAHKGNCKNPVHGHYTGLGTITVKNVDTQETVDKTYHTK